MDKYFFVSAFSNLVGASSRTYAVFERVAGEKTVLTVDFCHQTKQYYGAAEAEHKQQVMLHVPGYKRNLSVARIWSHIVFARRVGSYLKAQKEIPAAIYCAMPTSSAAYVCAKYCKRHGVKFVIDVIDLWPDSLLPLVKGQKIIKFLLSPWVYLTRYAYRRADVILGESAKYVQEAKKYNAKAEACPIYLGIDTHIADKVRGENPVALQKAKDEVWIGYAGSLGTSYDFQALLDAVKSIHGKYKYKLWFVGDGVRREEIAGYIAANGLNAEITGFLSHEQLLGYLDYCDIAVNIFRDNTKVVYSYKFNDYVAMNCFVLNSLEGETAEMVDAYQVGRNFNFSDKPLSAVLEDTLSHWDTYSQWTRNHQRLIDEKLDKDKVYDVVERLFRK